MCGRASGAASPDVCVRRGRPDGRVAESEALRQARRAGRRVAAGIAVNPSLGAPPRHPWRGRSRPATRPPDPPRPATVVAASSGGSASVGDAALDRDTRRPATCVDDPTLNVAAKRDATPTRGWFRIAVRDRPRQGWRGGAPRDGFTAIPNSDPESTARRAAHRAPASLAKWQPATRPTVAAPLLARDQRLHHPRPGPREVLPVVPAAAHRQHPAVAESRRRCGTPTPPHGRALPR